MISLLATAGHVWYWYWPRLHPAAPDPESSLAGWLSDVRFPLAIWIPFPHQNLAMLEAAAGLDRPTLAAAGRLAGVEEPALPTFGALRVPPARALVLLSDEEGEHFAIGAEVYPIFAWFSRLAGWAAGNPWLGGGEVMVDGRLLVVRWYGTLWSVAAPSLPNSEGDTALPQEPALALIQTRRALELVPAGRLHLTYREDRGSLHLCSAGRVDWPSAPPLEGVNAYLVAYADRKVSARLWADEPVVDFGRAPRQALIFFSHPDAGSTDLPRAAIVADADQRWDLPAEGLLELTGHEPKAASHGPWRISAFEEESLTATARLLPDIEAFSSDQDRPAIEFGLWLELAAAASEVERLGRMIERAPLLPRRKVERWRDIQVLLRALADRFDRISLVILAEPSFCLEIIGNHDSNADTAIVDTR